MLQYWKGKRKLAPSNLHPSDKDQVPSRRYANGLLCSPLARLLQGSGLLSGKQSVPAVLGEYGTKRDHLR